MIELKNHSKEYYTDKTKNLKIISIPCRSDNYTYIALSGDEKEAILIDCADHAKTLKTLKQLNVSLKAILITHHHHDHVDGIDKIATAHPNAKIYCSKKEQERMVFNTKSEIVFDDDKLDFFNEEVQVLSTPGHTSSLTSYYFKNSNALFCGDLLFSLGCGRVFENYPGVFNEFYNSLKKIITNTNDQTKIFCAHEYTKNNLAFLKSLKKIDNDLTDELNNRISLLGGSRSIPTDIKFEKKYNEFLKAKSASDFQTIRNLKDKF